MPSLWADDLDAHRKLVLGRLLDAYEELRAVHGPDGVTLAAVAARAGLARSAVYNYVANKHDLILTHAARGLAAGHQRLADAVGRQPDPAQALAAYITETLRVHSETPAAGDELMGMLSPEEQRELVALLQPTRDLLDRILTSGVADGTFTTDPARAADLVWAVLAGYRVPVATGRLDAHTTATYTANALLRALRAQ